MSACDRRFKRGDGYGTVEIPTTPLTSQMIRDAIKRPRVFISPAQDAMFAEEWGADWKRMYPEIVITEPIYVRGPLHDDLSKFVPIGWRRT